MGRGALKRLFSLPPEQCRPELSGLLTKKKRKRFIIRPGNNSSSQEFVNSFIRHAAQQSEC
jgi:hypothetical protein